MTDWISFGVVSVVILVFISIFYHKLQGPLHSLWLLIKRLFGSAGEKISEINSSKVEKYYDYQ